MLSFLKYCHHWGSTWEEPSAGVLFKQQQCIILSTVFWYFTERSSKFTLKLSNAVTIKLCLDHKTTPLRVDIYKNEVLFLFVVSDCLLSKDTAKLLLLQQTSNYDSDHPPPNTQRNRNLPKSNRCQQHLQFNLSWENTLCHMMKHQKKIQCYLLFNSSWCKHKEGDLLFYHIFWSASKRLIASCQWGSSSPKEE